jgi:ABC-2 type transport system permease protein
MNLAGLVARRELREILRDPNLLFPLLFLPCLMGCLIGISAFASFGGGGGGTTPLGTAVTNAALDQLPQPALQRFSNLPTDDRFASVETLLKALSIPVFWVIPVALTPAIAADSFVGERERGSLEPLLATPISTRELLGGKVAAAALPAVLGTWLGTAVFSLMVVLSGSPLYPRLVLADPDWRFSTLVVVPLVALLTAGVAALISLRVSAYRVAYQLNGLIVLPVVLLLIPLTAFLFLITPLALLYVALLLLAVDLALAACAVRLFDRERLLRGQ